MQDYKDTDDERTPHQEFSDLIQQRIKEAKEARASSGIEQQWEEDEAQYNGEETEQPAGDTTRGASKSEPFGNNVQQSTVRRSKVFLNITAPKTDVGVARVQEILLPHDDKPWAIEPTPIPELDGVAEDDETPVTLGDGTQAPAGQVAKVALQKAEEKAGNMSDWIEDKFVEGGVYGELRKLIADAGRLGSGVLKGPFAVTRTSKKWQLSGNVATMDLLRKVEPASKRISVWDFWHDPACGESIHDGSYCVERDYLTARQLRKMAAEIGQDGQPVYNVEAIAYALKEGPSKQVREHRRREKQQLSESQVFEVYHFYGDVEIETLEGVMGVDTSQLSETERCLAAVPAIVTMLNGRAIRASLMPVEMGDAFPFDVFTWKPVEGQVYGKGIPRQMRVAQRMLNAAIRKLMENAGLSAGPQVVFADGCITPAAGGRYAIEGRSMWKFTPNEVVKRVQDAFAVFNIPSMQRELAEIIEFALRMADELTNLPLLLQGMQGAAPDTVGGMTMLLNNANSPLRVIGKQFDDQVVAPHLGRYYDWGMQAAPDDCKGDMQVQARGSSVLVAREEAKQALIQMAPMLENPKFKLNPTKWLEMLLRAVNIKPQDLQYSDAEWEEIERKMAEQGQVQDPRLAAAEIRAQTEKMRAESSLQLEQLRQEFEREQKDLDRRVSVFLKNMDREIELIQASENRDFNWAQLKANLTTEALKIRSADQEMRLKLSLGSGI